MILRIYPHIIIIPIVVLHGIIIQVAGKADIVCIRVSGCHFLGIIGVFVRIDVQHRGFILNQRIMGCIDAIAGSIKFIAAAEDRNITPLVSFCRNIGICGFDAITHGGDQLGGGVFQGNTVIAL